MTLGTRHDAIPAFRAGPRDRYAAGVEGRWYPAQRVLLDLSWAGLMDQHPDGHRVVGSGDLELGCAVRLPVAEAARARASDAGRRGPAFGIGWRVKLPNAADEGELGSDETDVALLASAATDLGPLRGWVGGGLAILGDPLLLAAQDDLAFLQGGLSWEPSSAPAWAPRTGLQLGAALPSPSNPLRAELGGSLGWGRRWSPRLGFGVGLSAAAPTWSAALGVERRFLPR